MADETIHMNHVEFSVPLSGSQLFDIHAYVTAKNLCTQFPGLECDYSDKTKIRIFGDLNDYWFDQYNKTVFESLVK